MNIVWRFKDGTPERILLGVATNAGALTEKIGVLSHQEPGYDTPTFNTDYDGTIIRNGSSWDFELHNSEYYQEGELCLGIRCSNGTVITECITTQGNCE